MLGDFNVKTVLMTMASAGLLAILVGCGSSKCEQVCQKYNGCGVKERDHTVDCPIFCGNVDSFEKRAGAVTLEDGGQSANGCQSEFDGYLSCWQTNIGAVCADQTTADSPCAAQAASWSTCLNAYCTKTGGDGGYPNGKDIACVETDDAPYAGWTDNTGEPPFN
jgi:hypothetical protein